MLAPIILFTYNRPSHTQKTLNALRKNHLASSSDLFVYSDAPKDSDAKEKVTKVRTMLKNITGFRKVKIIERATNYGLAKSIIEGVSQVLDEYGKAIILEDDLVSSPAFLSYMNGMLDIYEGEPSIFSVSGYNHPNSLVTIPESYPYDIFFTHRACSWGWATWKDRWDQAQWDVPGYKSFIRNRTAKKKFDRGGNDRTMMLAMQMNEKINSWAIRWDFTHFLHEGRALYPVHSYIQNVGVDNSGTHCSATTRYQHNNLALKKADFLVPQTIEVDEQILDQFEVVMSPSFIDKFIFSLLPASLYCHLKAIQKHLKKKML